MQQTHYAHTPSRTAPDFMPFAVIFSPATLLSGTVVGLMNTVAASRSGLVREDWSLDAAAAAYSWASTPIGVIVPLEA